MTTQIDTYLAHFQWRVLQDALTQATADHWDQRAQALEWARPRRGDHLPPAAGGRARALAKAATRAKHRELTQLAAMCRHKAQLLRETGLDAEAHAAIDMVLGTHTGQVA